MALTLLEAAKRVSYDSKRSAVIELFPATSEILNVIPFHDVGGLSETYMEEAKLPSVGFRGINESFGNQDIGILNPKTEILKIAGGEIDVDTVLLKGPNKAQVRTSQETMKIKSLALRIGANMINGNSDINKREFDGLRRRIVNRQLFNATGGNGSGAMRLAVLDEAIDSVAGPTHIICNKPFRRKLTQAAKDGVGGNITWQKDDFGRQIAVYNDLPLVVLDGDEMDNQIIDYNEAGPDANPNTMSAYVVSIGEGKIMGLQNDIMDVRDLGELNDKSAMRTRIDWVVSLCVYHGRAAARIRGITNADFVK